MANMRCEPTPHFILLCRDPQIVLRNIWTAPKFTANVPNLMKSVKLRGGWLVGSQVWVNGPQFGFFFKESKTDSCQSLVTSIPKRSHLIESASFHSFKFICGYYPKSTLSTVSSYCSSGGNVAGADGPGPPLSHFTHPPSGIVAL